jgi:hypothetical protein
VKRQRQQKKEREKWGTGSDYLSCLGCLLVLVGAAVLVALPLFNQFRSDNPTQPVQQQESRRR